MKLLLLIATLSVAYAIDIKPFVEQENEQLFKYNPSDEYTLPADIDEVKPAVHFSGNEKFAKTLDSENKNQGQGKFKYSLHTQNGIELNQVGKLKDENTFVVSGSYSYTGADGKKYRVRYTADEYGYHPITELDVDIPEPDSGFQLLKQKLPYGGDSSIGDGYSYNPPEEPTNEYLPPETPSRAYLPASY